MKKVIDGKTYNTETATEVAYGGNGLPTSDFKHESTSLYRTRKGAWFLHGHGGPMSRWAVSLSYGGVGGGAGIQVLTEAEALEWCEWQNVDPDVIEEHFEIEEG